MNLLQKENLFDQSK